MIDFADDTPQAPAADNPVAARVQEIRAEEQAQPVRRGRGRPRGSRTRNRRPPPAAATPAPAAAPDHPVAEPPSEGDLRGLGKLLGTAWRIVGLRLQRRPLTDAEEYELAQAAHPILVKYGALSGRWAAEVNLGVTLFGLWLTTEIPPPAPAAADDYTTATA